MPTNARTITELIPIPIPIPFDTLFGFSGQLGSVVKGDDSLVDDIVAAVDLVVLCVDMEVEDVDVPPSVVDAVDVSVVADVAGVDELDMDVTVVASSHPH